ncbi:MAG TPA: hypothetical protein VNO83_03250 [Pseudonocardia sp.]|nr:hypothetical protein [Pseudonocardia sp.]
MSTARTGRTEVGRTGARFGRFTDDRKEREPAAGAGDGSDSAAAPADFTTVARGYERQEVDRFVTGQQQQAAELQAALAAAERRIHELTERVAATERARSGQPGPESAPSAGYGARAEKLLRMAESEAVEMRANASQEARALVEQARVAAEQHRHESEQVVIARFREVDADMRRRVAQLEDREQKVAQQLHAGRAEAERLQAAAAEAAGKLRDEARAEAELIKARARAEAGRTSEEIRVERNRVTELRADVHAELERINRMIVGQLTPET